MVKIVTTHNVGSSLRVWLVTLPDQHLTRPCLAECVLGYASGSAVDRVNSSVHVQCVITSRPILSRPCLLRPWYGCLSVVACGDSSTTSQAEVPLERIHAFYREMGPFRIMRLVICSLCIVNITELSLLILMFGAVHHKFANIHPSEVDDVSIYLS